MRALVSAVALGLLAAGCASTAPRPGVPDARAPVQPELSAEERTLNAMLERARSARLAGRLVEAEATLESALRIAPEDARAWLELAEVQFASGDFSAARTLADRAISLSDGDQTVVEAAQRLSAQMAE
jgi:Tfp pilus assembly protein PilF